MQAEKSPWPYRRAWRLVGSAVAPARLASLAPKVGGRLEQPQCHRQRKNSLFIAFTPQDVQKPCKVADLQSCAAEPV